jgi:acetyl esterase/lipase
MDARVRRLEPLTLGHHDAVDASIVARIPWERDDQRLVRNVTVPTLTPYLPDPGTGTGTGVVIAPGGGLHFLAFENEGSRVAEQLAERGIAAFVLHYRTAPTPVDEQQFLTAVSRAMTTPGVLDDTARALRGQCAEDGRAAVRLVRENAATWSVAPDRVGMLGFSAGAFVALATCVAGADDERPSFLAPLYAGMWDSPAVPEPPPPLFLAWATDDQLGDRIIRTSLTLYEAWRNAGASVEAHAYARGGHGFGIRSQGTPSDAWFDAFLGWLAASGF